MSEMRVDVSEIKARRDCGRKWAFSSRNYYHMKPKVENPNLRFGSLFHEALAGLYLSKGDEDKIQKTIDKYVGMLTDPGEQRTMTCMLMGYAAQVLPGDLARYEVLDIEHKFRFKLPDELVQPPFGWAKDLTICGSIDMILRDRETDCIVGFEHKTCKNFRTLFYNAMDEQPRTYFIALQRYVETYNKHYGTHYKNGGIYLNETRKLKTRFDHNRIDPIIYSEQECIKFLEGFRATAEQIYFAPMRNSNLLPEPEPGYMKCLLCDFKDECQYFGYQRPSKEEILEEFVEEIEVREYDHLDEKVQRSGETEDAIPPEYSVEK